MMKFQAIRLAVLLLGTSLLAVWPLTSSAVPEAVPSVSSQQQAIQQAVQKALPPNEQLPAAPSLNEAVNRFFQQLAAQKGFESWQQATWTSYPLGPGSHGWVILVKSNGQEIGYMIVHAAQEGTYQLTEYGNGEYPLFSFQTLYQTLMQQELIPSSLVRWYVSPLQAVWELTLEGNSGEPLYIDAKTGELLPLTKDVLQESMLSGSMNAFTKPEPAHTIIETGTTAPFDPYAKLPWVVEPGETGGQVHHPYQELKADLVSQRRLTFAAELFDGRITVPLAVTGFQEWSDSSRYMRVHQDDERFLPFEAMDAAGYFFP
jgi:hypothetical protein